MNAATGAPEIIVDNGDFLPAERAGTIGQRVLTALTFQIVMHLISRRLTQVNYGLAL